MNRDPLIEFSRDDPGSPLGRGYPSGTSLRLDAVFDPDRQIWRGESHRMAWERILRNDPCAYCGAPQSGTLDHIVPRNPLVKTPVIGGKFSWLNLAGSCESCNGRKGSKNLLEFVRHQPNMFGKVKHPTKERKHGPVEHHRGAVDRRRDLQPANKVAA